MRLEPLTIVMKPSRAATLLKKMANSLCADGEEWYEVDETEVPTFLDLNLAIDALEKMEERRITLVDDTEEAEQ